MRSSSALTLIVGLLVGLGACSSGGSPPPAPRATDVGWLSLSTSVAHAPTAMAPKVLERWDVAAKLGGLHTVRSRAHSEHEGGDVEADVLASAGFVYPPRGESPVVPEGTLVVERLFSPGDPALASFLVMAKKSPGFDVEGADWEYVVVRPSGQVEARGKVASCKRCHAEAPHAGIFGGPTKP